MSGTIDVAAAPRPNDIAAAPRPNDIAAAPRPNDVAAAPVPEGSITVGPMDFTPDEPGPGKVTPPELMPAVPGQAGAASAPTPPGAAPGTPAGTATEASPAEAPPAATPAAGSGPAPGPAESYEDSVARRQADAAVSRAAARRAARERQRQAKEAVASPPATPLGAPLEPGEREAAREAYVEQRVAALPPAPNAMPGGAANAAETPGEEKPAPEPAEMPTAPIRPGRGTPEAQAAAKTLVRGASEVALAIPRGVIGAFASAFEAADDLADWLSGSKPSGDPSLTSEPGRAIGGFLRGLMPGTPPQTVAGKVTEEIAQFVTGFLRGGALLKARGLLQGSGRAQQAGRAAAAGAIADFFYQEADEDNLAAAWEKAGLPRNALTEFLATDPEDSAASNRLRNAVAGVVVGAALDGAMALASAARAGLAARRQAVAAGAPPPVAPDPNATLADAAGVPARPERDVLILGDPARPLVEVVPRGDPTARLAEAAAATSDAATGVASHTAAAGLVSAAREALARLRAFVAPDWVRGEPLTEAEVMARGDAADAALIPEGVRALLEAMRKGRIGPRGEVGLTAFIRAHGGMQDAGGDVLAALGGTTRTAPGLIARNGMRQERMMEAAIEQGYVPADISLREFLDRVAEDATGRLRHYGSSEDAAGRALQAAARDLDEMLAAHGLSPQSSDAAIGTLFRDPEAGAPTGTAPATAPRLRLAPAAERYTAEGPDGLVRAADGSVDLGRMPEGVAGVAPLPIRLARGEHDEITKGGRGVTHIAARREGQIAEDPAEFAARIIAEFNEVRRGAGDTIFLVQSAPNARHGDAAIVALERTAGGYYQVITAGRWRRSYIDQRELLWEGERRSPLEPGAKAGNPLQRGGQSDANLGKAVGDGNAGLPLAANSAAIRRATDPGEVFINWGRIATPDDVQAVMRDMAEAFRGKVNEAGRGVQTNEETAKLAEQLGLTPTELLSRQRGQPFNAETALAARQLYTASGEKLLEAARMAAAPGSGALEQAAFRRMMATHYAIQAEVLGARAEAGRALQAWAIPAASGGRQMRMIEDLMEASGGVDVSRAMAARLAILSRELPAEDLARALGRFVDRGWGARGIEAVQQVWINALLSSPASHLANIAGNALNIPLAMVERAATAGVGQMTGSADAAVTGEAAVMLYATITGFRDALRLAARSYGDDGAEIARMIGRQDLPRQGAISSQALGADPGSGLGLALDFVGHQVVSAPGRAMGAEDAFFKSIVYRNELHAQALRQAVRDAPRRADGSADPAAVGEIMAGILRNPPEAVTRAAADEALYRTFNREAGPIAQRLMQLRNTESPGWNLFMATVMPFVRTPANLFSYSLERTPLAPLVGQWRADLAAGGARRDAALARVAVGSMVMATTYQYAEQGLVTGHGPTDPEERAAWLRTGAQPYSLRVGDAWVPFNRLDPYGFVLGFAADLREVMDRRDLGQREEAEVSKLIAAAAGFVGQAMGERAMFRGVTAVAEAIDTRQPSAERFVGQTASALLVPGVVAAAGQALDPTLYDRGQGWIAARLAGLASDPGIPRRNNWGEVMKRPGVAVLGAAGAAISPIKPTRDGGRPIDQEMRRLGMGLDAVDRNGTVAFGTAMVGLRALNPAALDQLRRWAGNEMGLPAFGGLGLADALDEMVGGGGPFGKAFARASDEGKEKAIRQVAVLYRKAARDRLLADPRFPGLAELVRTRKGEAAEGRGEVPIPQSLGPAMREPGQDQGPRRRAAASMPVLR